MQILSWLKFCYKKLNFFIKILQYFLWSFKVNDRLINEINYHKSSGLILFLISRNRSLIRIIKRNYYFIVVVFYFIFILIHYHKSRLSPRQIYYPHYPFIVRSIKHFKVYTKFIWLQSINKYNESHSITPNY